LVEALARLLAGRRGCAKVTSLRTCTYARDPQ
jgi:hypothetical protein